MPRRGATRFKLFVVVPPEIDGLPPELKQFILMLLAENAELKRQNAELRADGKGNWGQCADAPPLSTGRVRVVV